MLYIIEWLHLIGDTSLVDWQQLLINIIIGNQEQ